MPHHEIVKIREHKELVDSASLWFHQKWNIPREAYLDSMTACTENTGIIPQWYILYEGEQIIAGLGVIENDFHNRPDLTPNICAVYVEPDFRNRGIAGELLEFACSDLAAQGIETLYLLTDHVGFYERYGWEFLCMVQGDGEDEPSRMYVHHRKAAQS